MSEVVSLRGEPIAAAGEPNKEALAAIEDWYERIASGEVVGIAIAGHYKDGGSGRQWAGVTSAGIVGQCFMLANCITEHLTTD